MAITVGVVSLGCSKNQVDAERILWGLKNDGFELGSDPALCDVVIINTCGFIESAKQESIDYILEFVTLKQEGQIKVVAITGCLAERYRDEIAKEIPEADIILGIGSNSELTSSIKAALSGEKVQKYGEKTNLSIEGSRVLGNLPYFAYLKIAEGCDNCCSYCAIPLIRGAFRSRTIENIVKEAKELAEYGVTELNVVAQDSTRYGEDIYGEYRLAELLKELCKIPEIRWIRVLYCYPERITDKLLDTMANEPKIVKYLDLPLQHVSKRVLSDMNRSGSNESLRELISKIRIKIPNIAIRTTFITGFPGETEEEFEELCLFVEDMKFERMGCFPYSAEEDTPAALMPDQIDQEIKERRSEVLMEIQMEINAKHNQNFVGKELLVLCEGFDRIAESWFGRSYMDAPEVDGKIFFTTDKIVKPGNYVNIIIEDSMDYDLIGTTIKETED